VESGVTRNGDVQIAYEDFGKPGGRPLLLISGLDSQMIGWPDGFCEALAGAGFHVVRCARPPITGSPTGAGPEDPYCQAVG
jgi:pimeloyl-ACP methyl ester carboxylesterase